MAATAIFSIRSSFKTRRFGMLTEKKTDSLNANFHRFFNKPLNPIQILGGGHANSDRVRFVGASFVHRLYSKRTPIRRSVS